MVAPGGGLVLTVLSRTVGLPDYKIEVAMSSTFTYYIDHIVLDSGITVGSTLTAGQRIGHTGTLDPLATGVLALACGRATRLVRFLTASDKDYEATIRFGRAIYRDHGVSPELYAQVVKAFGQYTNVKDDDTEAKDKIFQVGASVPVTDKAAVLASFGQLKNKTAADVTTKDEVFSLGYDYTVSKRTDIYGVFSNHRVSGLVSGQSLAVGLRHNF